MSMNVSETTPLTQGVGDDLSTDSRECINGDISVQYRKGYDDLDIVDKSIECRENHVTGVGGATEENEVDVEILTQSGSHIICRSTELDKHDLSTKTSNMECLMHLLKGMVGTGILAMPIGFKNGGLWVGFVFVLLIGAICTHCMHLLVLSGDELCRKTGENHLGYPMVLEKAFETKGGRLKKYSMAGRNIINAFLILTQFGFCCVYTVFVAQNVKQVIDHLHPHSLSDVTYIVIVSVALVPYIMVKSLKALVPFSAFANILNTVGLVIIFSDLFQGLPSASSRPAFGSFKLFPLFFGQAIFAFEGIGLVLPLHDKMKEREAFLGKFGVLNLGLTTTVCLYTAMGFYGYLKYGDEVKGSVTLNLDNNNWLYLSAKLMFAISLFISYGLQFYVPINIIWPFIERKMAARGRHLQSYWQYLFRFFLVCVTCGLSSLVPHLDLLISLVGACASSFLALIFPPLIDMMVFPAKSYIWAKNILVIIIGVVGFITGTYTSLQAIAETF